MIINSKFKIYPSIFIHIPKCGGSSMKQILNDINDKEVIHSKLKDDFKLLYDKQIGFEKYFVFALIRNPWDRVISYYFFYKNIIKKEESISISAKKYNFKDWLKIIFENKKEYFFIHENYLDYLTYKEKVYIDYAMNFHLFNEECNLLKSILKINSEDFHLNKTIHGNYKKYYSDKEINFVNDIYKKDIEFFNFDFYNTIQMKEIKNHDKIKLVSSKKLFM